MYIYFIGCYVSPNQPSFIKIGVSKNPPDRIGALQTSNPHKLKILRTVRIPTEMQAYAIEKRLHKVFKKAKKHKRGEWFDYSVLDDAVALCEKYANKNFRWKNEIVPKNLDIQHLERIRAHL